MFLSWRATVPTVPNTTSNIPISSSMNCETRQLIAQDTVNRSKSIIKGHIAEGATQDSTFYSEQLPPLGPPDKPRGRKLVTVLNSDAYTVARKMIDEDPNAKGNVAVLNLASDEYPGGGWLETLSRTQEEALCYSSTLYATLNPSWYPWPNTGPGSVVGGFFPGVVVFKNDLDHDCADLPEDHWRVVSVITVAAPCNPELTEDEQEFENKSDLEDLRGKIKLIYRMAIHNEKRYLVLGAMGCGAYACPAELVAKEMRTILLDAEFKEQFERVVFAVYSKGGGGNFDVFRQAFEGVNV